MKYILILNNKLISNIQCLFKNWTMTNQTMFLRTPLSQMHHRTKFKIIKILSYQMTHVLCTKQIMYLLYTIQILNRKNYNWLIGMLAEMVWEKIKIIMLNLLLYPEDLSKLMSAMMENNLSVNSVRVKLFMIYVPN